MSFCADFGILLVHRGYEWFELRQRRCNIKSSYNHRVPHFCSIVRPL